MMKNILNFKFILKIIISSLLLYYILSKANFDVIIASMRNADYIILFLAFLLHFLGLLISTFRWQILLRAQKIKTKLSTLYKSYLVATFFNHFLPSTVGGDSVRAYDSWKIGKNKEKAFTVVILDRFFGVFVLLLFAIISLLFSPDLGDKIEGIYLWISILTIGAIFLIWFILSPPLMYFSRLSENSEGIISKLACIIFKLDLAFSEFSEKKEKLWYAFILSVFLQLNVVFYYFLISEALNLNIAFIDYFLIVPLTIFITMLPISLNGIGLRENALFLFLSQFGVLHAESVAFAWLEYGMLLVLGIIGGLVYLLRK